MKMRAISFVLFLSSAFFSFAEEIKTDFRELEKTILEELKEKKVKGGVIAIIKGDAVVYSKGFGTSTIEANAPITTDSILRTASVGKMLTAAAVAKLADEGKLKFDEPIGSYVKGLAPKISKLTLQQLLSHTSGLRDVKKFSGTANEADIRSDILSWKDDLFFDEPGKVFSYSNIGYSLAGLVIEELTGKSYPAAMDDLVFKPLGMSHTTFPAILSKNSPESQKSNDKEKLFMGFTDFATYRPVGFHVSTIHDLARFAMAILHQGKIDGKQVLPSSVFTKISTPHTPMHSHPLSIYYEDAQYGCGLIIHPHRGVQIVEHTGKLPGFGARLLTVPEHQFAVITMANNSGESLTKSVEKAMELMLPLKPKSEPNKSELPSTAEEIKDYVGTYCNPADQDEKMEIFVKNEKLFAKESGQESPLKKVGANRFIMTIKNESSDFLLVPGANGKIAYRHKGLRVWKKV
jgi:CubicO group peptidase (beta-lactamase class C family)